MNAFTSSTASGPCCVTACRNNACCTHIYGLPVCSVLRDSVQSNSPSYFSVEHITAEHMTWPCFPLAETHPRQALAQLLNLRSESNTRFHGARSHALSPHSLLFSIPLWIFHVQAGGLHLHTHAHRKEQLFPSCNKATRSLPKHVT